MTKLTHTDAHGRATMVDTSAKEISARRAVASAKVSLNRETVQAIRDARTPKGNPLEVARLAGILAAKRTDELIPLCHSLPLNAIDVRAELRDDGVYLQAEAVTKAQTGVEMEAMVAVSIAALTVYDMTKALDKSIVISDIQLESKRGGKSGVWERG